MDDLWIALSETNDYYLYEIGDVLWSGAADRWNDATDEQQKAVLERWIDYVENSQDDDNAPDKTDFNDFVWFDCDDIFFPDEYGEENEF